MPYHREDILEPSKPNPEIADWITPIGEPFGSPTTRLEDLDIHYLLRTEFHPAVFGATGCLCLVVWQHENGRDGDCAKLGLDGNWVYGVSWNFAIQQGLDPISDPDWLGGDYATYLEIDLATVCEWARRTGRPEPQPWAPRTPARPTGSARLYDFVAHSSPRPSPRTIRERLRSVLLSPIRILALVLLVVGEALSWRGSLKSELKRPKP